jgi:L-lactate dehydrogenase complex protein LldG
VVVKTRKEAVVSDARTDILSRVRKGLGIQSRAMNDDYNGIARDYKKVGQLNTASRLDLFEDRLRDYDAVVYRCASSTLAETIASALDYRGKRRLLIPEGLSKSCLPGEPSEFIPDRGLELGSLDHSEGVITGCAVAIAITGTIILKHSPATGRRALTLIPDYHLCVIDAAQVVETVSEGIRALGDVTTMPITTISGPSATADIEMTRIKGVHGPRTLDVILVI